MRSIDVVHRIPAECCNSLALQGTQPQRVCSKRTVIMKRDSEKQQPAAHRSSRSDTARAASLTTSLPLADSMLAWHASHARATASTPCKQAE